MKKEGVYKDNTIYGRNPVLESLQRATDIDKVLILKSIRGAFEKEVRKLCRERNIPLQYVPSNKLDRITRKNHQGIIAFTTLVEYQDLEQIIPFLYEKGTDPLILLLDGITDVRNFGAIARSAEVFGADAIVIGEKNSARITNDAVKTSAGAIMKIPICREKNLRNAIQFLKESGFSIFSSDLNTDYSIQDINFNQPCVVILGSEGLGVSRSITEECDQSFKIPQIGETDSLNVSVATGVILYEIMNQRSV